MTMTHVSHLSSILIIKPSSLGDIFHTFPAVKLLQMCYPEAVFDWLIKPELADAIKFAPVKIRRVIPFKRTALGKTATFLPELTKLVKDLRQDKYDLVIDFQGLFRSAIFCPVIKGKTVGFTTTREPLAKWFYHQKIAIANDQIHAVERNLALVEQLTGRPRPDRPIPPLPTVPEAAESVKQLMKREGITFNSHFIGIIPGARWESKRWPTKFFGKLINKIHSVNQDSQFLLLGSKDTIDIAEEIMQLTTNSKIVFSLAGKTSIGELVEALRLCNPIISNDSGPSHIAAALDKTVFGLFGPTDPTRTGPYGTQHVFFQRDIPCIKCLKKNCRNGSFSCHDLNIDEIVNRLQTHIYDG